MQCPHNIKEGGMYEMELSNLTKHAMGKNTPKEIVPLISNTEPIRDSVVQKGICNEMINFITSLADKGDSASMVWEKYHIYKARIQEAEDYKDYIELKKKIQQQEKRPTLNEDELKYLRMDKAGAKIWWHRLNQHVIQSMQKVADREAKKTVDGKVPGIMHAKTINFNIGKKEIEDKSGEK